MRGDAGSARGDRTGPSEVAARDDDTGRTVKEILAEGRFVSDDLATEIVVSWMGGIGNGSYVLDGFPRTVEQARRFDMLPLSEGLVAVELTVDGAVLLERKRVRVATDLAAGRLPREDDVPEVFGERQRQYVLKTAPVVEHYRSCGRLVRVDGMAAPALVTEAMMEAVRSLT